jgi:hypothetical protein
MVCIVQAPENYFFASRACEFSMSGRIFLIQDFDPHQIMSLVTSFINFGDMDDLDLEVAIMIGFKVGRKVNI